MVVLEATREAKATHKKPTATWQFCYLMQQRCNRKKRVSESDNGSRRVQLAAHLLHSPDSLLAEGRRHFAGDTGLQEEYEKASRRVFQIPRGCARKHRDGYRTRTSFGALKRTEFLQASREK